MWRNIISKNFRFSNEKYFLDTYYKSMVCTYSDVVAISNDTPGALTRMCNLFSSYGVNLTYLRTHF